MTSGVYCSSDSDDLEVIRKVCRYWLFGIGVPRISMRTVRHGCCSLGVEVSGRSLRCALVDCEGVGLVRNRNGEIVGVERL